MDDLKPVIAKSISELRKKHGMTQLDLAEKLNYSDKAVSKWERAESVPDISALKEMSVLFGVTVDYIINEDKGNVPADLAEEKVNRSKVRYRNHLFIMGMSILLVWLVATFVFVMLDILSVKSGAYWLVFVYSVPTSVLVWLVFNTVWFNRRKNFPIISFLMWTLLACVEVTFLAAGFDVWQIFLLGIPGQIIIIMWSRLKKVEK